MEKIYDKCCGIDVHKKLMAACFLHGREKEIREFGATTRELLELAQWLSDGDCEMVAMESTASYWKPLYNVLESSDIAAMVVNARDMKNVPGRKTDVQDAEWIADLLKHGLLKASSAQLADDLNGVMTQLQCRLMKEVLRHIDEPDEQIKNLDDDINNQMKDDEKKASTAIQEITGIAEASANAIISVIGTDMGRFPTDAHISSWAGLCPGNNESAKKCRSGKTCKGNALLRSTLVVCAHSAVKNKNSYFYAQFQRISVHRGKKRAYVAIAHSMLIAIYHVLKEGVVFKDLGAEYYNQFNKERKINAYLKKLKALGWEQPTAMVELPA